MNYIKISIVWVNQSTWLMSKWTAQIDRNSFVRA